MMAHVVPALPFRCVPMSVREKIADILDPDSVFELSWKAFAERLNQYFDRTNVGCIFSSTKINAISGRRPNSCTMDVLGILAQGNIITTDIVQEVLMNMGSAAADVLPRHIHDISAMANAEKYPVMRDGCHHSCLCHSCAQCCVSAVSGPVSHHHHYKPSNVNQNRQDRQSSRPDNLNQINGNYSHLCQQREHRNRNHNGSGGNQQIQVPVDLHPSNKASGHQQHTNGYHIDNSNGSPKVLNIHNQSTEGQSNDNRSGVCMQAGSPLLSPGVSTSNNVSSDSDLHIVDRQNRLLNQVRINSDIVNNFKGHDLFQNYRSEDLRRDMDTFEFIPPDSESDTDSLDQETVTKESESVDMRRHEGITNIEENNRHTESKFKSFPNDVQCTCDHLVDNRHSVPLVTEEPRSIDRNCYSEPNLGQKLKRTEQKCTCNRDKRKLKIFTSYAMDSNNHLKEVAKMQHILKTHGDCIMKTDVMEGVFQKRMKNSHDWLEEEFSSADYVIFCISPKYDEYTKPESNDNCENSPIESRLHTRFIFDLARSEYVHNYSLNKRFLPVIFTNSGAELSHLPAFMRATIWYYYPNDSSMKKLLSYLDENGIP